LWNSSTGEIFAAFKGLLAVEPLLEAEFTAMKRANGLTDAALRRTYHRKLDNVRERGISRNVGSRYPGITSFSAPMFDANGQILLSISVFGLSNTLCSAWTSSVLKLLSQHAADITRHSDGAHPSMVNSS